MAMERLAHDAALLVIDYQEDFCEPHGALAVPGGRNLAPTINSLLKLPFKLKIATRDFHPADHCSFASQHPGKAPFDSQHTIRNPEALSASHSEVEQQTTVLWPDHCVQGTPGCELIPELDKPKLDHIIDKGQDTRVESYFAFGPPFRNPPVAMTQLQDVLQTNNIKRVFVCGLAYDYCVKETAIDAVKAGFKTFVVIDGTKAVDQSREGMAKTGKDLITSEVGFVTVVEVAAMF